MLHCTRNAIVQQYPFLQHRSKTAQRQLVITANTTHIYLIPTIFTNTARTKRLRVGDSEWLQEEIEKQGRQQYLLGNYELGKLNFQGQRISIRVTIPRKNGAGDVSFITGWMVKPGGKIKLTTPYGGK